MPQLYVFRIKHPTQLKGANRPPFFIEDINNSGINFPSGISKTTVTTGCCTIFVENDGTRTMCTYLGTGSLIDENEGKVPGTLDQLLRLKGVGRKTANLTLVLGHNRLGICVDIHVHRITNRWGYVQTNSPNETEAALRCKLPKRYWKEFNNLLVSFGQNICKPQSPHCSKCEVSEYCKQTGVNRYR